MSYKLVLSSLAKNDIQSAMAYYNGRKVGLGKAFLKAVKNAGNQLKRRPEIFALRYKNVR